jgi:lysyl-tRNA synthetase, class II
MGDHDMNLVADPRRALVSSWLLSMRYSPPATLDLEFRGGRVYRYFTVPRAVAEGLQGAASKGAYFNRSIKDRFPYQRLV